MPLLKVVATVFAFAVFCPLAADAQTATSTDKAQTSPSANDASYGTSASPASTDKSPVSMNPTAARKEGTAPVANGGGAPSTKP